MSKTCKTQLEQAVILPSDEENAAIEVGIRADEDNPEMTQQAFKRAVPATGFFTPEQMEALLSRRPRGRPHKEKTKVSISIRLDADLLEALRATGNGWQSRVNSILREKMMLD